jgi:hypothetical protein
MKQGKAPIDIKPLILSDKIAKAYLRQNNLIFVQISTYCLFICSNFDTTYEYGSKDLLRLSSWDKLIACLDKNCPSSRLYMVVFQKQHDRTARVTLLAETLTL